MRTAILVISVAVALFFGVSLVLTFFAHGYVRGVAGDFVVRRTQRFATPTVEVVHQALKAPQFRQWLDEDGLKTARQEVADYRRDPRAYIAGLVADDGPVAPDPDPDAPLAERVLGWKASVRRHFDFSLGRLLFDLRVFCVSNLVAALVAAWCALRARPTAPGRLAVVAGLLLASVAYGVYLYVDSLTYFRILFDLYLGWWYPLFLAVTFLGLYLQYGRESAPAAGPPQQSGTAPGGAERASA